MRGNPVRKIRGKERGPPGVSAEFDGEENKKKSAKRIG